MLHVKFEAHSMKIKGIVVVLQDQGLLGRKKRTIKKPFLSEKMPCESVTPNFFGGNQFNTYFATNILDKTSRWQEFFLGETVSDIHSQFYPWYNR